LTSIGGAKLGNIGNEIRLAELGSDQRKSNAALLLQHSSCLFNR
jgi:hypothetical protein